MGALVDHERAGGDLALVRAEVEQHVDAVASDHLAEGQTALPRHEAEIEGTDPCGGMVQHAEARTALAVAPIASASFAAVAITPGRRSRRR